MSLLDPRSITTHTELEYLDYEELILHPGYTPGFDADDNPREIYWRARAAVVKDLKRRH